MADDELMAQTPVCPIELEPSHGKLHTHRATTR
jgi:hypothetical protein